jgi:carboxylate-amine ligase
VQNLLGVDDRRLTVGVEEEFFVVDSASRRTVPRAQQILVDARRTLRDRVRAELTPLQVEVVTPICTDLRELGAVLTKARVEFAAAALRTGSHLLAAGTPPFDQPGPPPTTNETRYREMTDDFGLLLEDQGTCGCHFHIGVPDRKTAVGVCNHLRPWLAVLLALSANSPYIAGRSTGYASWRAILLARWPVAGPPPIFASAADYASRVSTMIAARAARDEQSLYWFVRPSSHWPTVEIRIADVQPSVEDTVLLAGLVRGLVAAAIDKISRGAPPSPVPGELLRIACWRAARDGLDGNSLDPETGKLIPAWRLVERLMDHVEPYLDGGDLVWVGDTLAVLRKIGCGADRQRREYSRSGDLADVVDSLIVGRAFAAENFPSLGTADCVAPQM